MYVQLPLWKCYLYSLIQRWRLYKAINTNRYRWGFNKEEVLLLRQMFSKYMVKGGMKKLNVIRYDRLIDKVLGHRIVVADKEEIELAHRLLIIKKINYRRLIMEIKQVKEFGKEVGLKLAEMNKLAEDELILEIIRNVEPKIQYSKELVAWYNELDDALFDKAEAESGATSDGESAANGDVSIADVIEVIEGYTKVAELKEILTDNDVAPLFATFDPAPFKMPKKLKAAMIEHLQTPAEKPDTNGDDQTEEILELINEAEDEDGLVTIYGEYQTVFNDMEVPDDIDAEALQTAMVAHVESKKGTTPEPDKPISLKDRLANKGKGKKDKPKVDLAEKFDWWTPDADGFSVDDAFAKVEELKMTELRQFAKHIGLSIGVGGGNTKDVILDKVASKIQEITEGVTQSTTAGEIELTAQLIKDAVKAKDREALAEMCEQADIQLNALQKKSIPGMEKKLLETIKDKTDDKSTTTKGKAKLSAKEPISDAQSVYAIMEAMVLEGKSEDAITKKVSPIYKEKGQSIIFIKKRVNTMTQIIKLDNNLE